MTEPLVTINDFHGPMDLLLHLVKAKNVDILTLDLHDVTKQYLTFVTNATVNIDVISIYLPLAAYLLELQSKQLLPQEEIIVDSDYEAEVNRQKLIARLLEYKKFKEISNFFKSQASLRQQLLTKAPSDLKTYIGDMKQKPQLASTNITKLTQAMLTLFNRLQKEQSLPINLSLNLISAEDRAMEIKQLLAQNPEKYFTLEQLFLTPNLTLHYFIITFIAILDLANHQYLQLGQQDMFSVITVIYQGENNE